MPTETTPLAGLSARPYAVPLGTGPAPEQVIRLLRRRQHPGVLTGQWFGGGCVVMHSPIRTASPETALEAARLVEDQPRLAGPPDGLGGGWLACLGYSPHTSWLGFYDNLLRWRANGSWTFESLGLEGRAEAMDAALTGWRGVLLDASAPSPAGPTWRVGRFSTFEVGAHARDQFLAAVEYAIGQIHRGAFYQVNLCTRLRADFEGDPLALFADMSAALQPSWGALVPGPSPNPLVRVETRIPTTRGGETTVASFSPELFLRLQGRRVTTSPIKGTAPRAAAESDSPTLSASAKDAAENIMIVDLMRNDLSRVSKPGTVVVEALLDLQPHPGVWHLVSTVSGELADDVSTADVLTATFPPGSVTGAPKSTAVGSIQRLEARSRGAYTGAIGFSTPGAGAEFNVLIRSFEITGDALELGVGGGITVDSVPVREWSECLDKAAPLVAAAGSVFHPDLTPPTRPAPSSLVGSGVFETMLAVGPNVLSLAAHLARLDRSCRELYGTPIPDDLAQNVRRAADTGAVSPSGSDSEANRQVVRVVARPARSGLGFTVVSAPARPRITSCRVVRAVRGVGPWRHKWVDRTELTSAEAVAGDQIPYFTTDSGEVAETSRGNIFCLGLDGVWLTPPLDEQLLPGVTRRDVLDLFGIRGVGFRLERFDPATLHTCRGAFWTSSLSGAVLITEADGVALPRPWRVTDEINTALGVQRSRASSMTSRAACRKPSA